MATRAASWRVRDHAHDSTPGGDRLAELAGDANVHDSTFGGRLAALAGSTGLTTRHAWVGLPSSSAT